MLTNLKAGVKTAAKWASKHSPEILTAAAALGVVATGYFAYRGGIKVGLEEAEEELTTKEKAKIIVKEMWPAVGMGGLTIAAIISSNIISIKRQKALASAYAITSEAYQTYKRHVIEKLGEKKEDELRGEIAESDVKADPPNDEVIFNTGRGNTLFKDRISGRYFRSDIDFVRRQQVTVNQWLMAGEDWVSVNDWYSLIGLENLEDLDDLGWNVEEGVHFDFNACLTPDNEPAIVIDYDISPRYDFRNLH